MNLRSLSARIIDDVTNGSSLSDRLAMSLPSLTDARDRAFVQAVCYGVCRYYSRLDIILSCLLDKPMHAKDTDVHALLLVGLYQLIDMRVPPHAAVAETVNATVKLKKPWARGLVNAVLREYQRSHEKIAAEIATDPEAQYAHPEWWIGKISKAWPEHWEKILLANNEHPPFSLRVNQRHLTRKQYIATLDIPAVIIPETQSGITLETPIAAEELPGFGNGDISVQDGAAQLAAELLMLQANQRVLDACAAPGGKLTHIGEIQTDLAALFAVEKDRERITPIKENLNRLNISAQCIQADVAAVSQWWDGQVFDRILLDAPCSASGVIRRHPDIKLLRYPTDIKIMAKEQLALLNALWPTLATGGILLYATCSIFPEENVAVIREFLAAHADASEEPINAAWGLACEFGRQILPGMHGMDGFYYARLKKLV